jgi:hypothetical protein
MGGYRWCERGEEQELGMLEISFYQIYGERDPELRISLFVRLFCK